MELDAYQQRARRTMHPGLSPRDGLLDAAAGLAEEAGEVLSHVRKSAFFNRSLDVEAIKHELGDALWCLAAVATHLDLSLGEIAVANLRKIELKAGKDIKAAAQINAETDADQRR